MPVPDQAVMTLDIGYPVGDAAWAPYSSTVLAAAGEDGRLAVGPQQSMHLISSVQHTNTHNLSFAFSVAACEGGCPHLSI